MSEHTEAASYALGLLDADEMARFEAHLAECDECAEQLEWMLPISERMADIEPGELFGVAGPSAFEVPPPGTRPLAEADPPARTLRAAPPPPPTPAGGYPIPSTDPLTGPVPMAPVTPMRPAPAQPPVRPVPSAPPARPVPLRPAAAHEPADLDDRRTISPGTGEIPMLTDTGTGRGRPAGRGDDRRRQQPEPARRTPRRSGGLLLAAAAAVIGVMTGAGAMSLVPRGDETPGIALPEGGDRLAATDARTGVHADVGLASKEWGTLVSFSVSDIDGPRECRLVAVRKDGRKEILSSWTVPEQGYGINRETKELSLEASTALRRDEIASLSIQDVGASGTTNLVTLKT